MKQGIDVEDDQKQDKRKNNKGEVERLLLG